LEECLLWARPQHGRFRAFFAFALPVAFEMVFDAFYFRAATFVTADAFEMVFHAFYFHFSAFLLVCCARDSFD
jgi:hypothetical protein